MTAAKVILYADDDRWFIQPFVEVLEDYGYKVIQATTGSEVIGMFSKEKIDLLILDILMPAGEGLADTDHGRRTGVRVAEILRREMKSKVPIIYLTVVSDQDLLNRINDIETEAGLIPKILIKPVLPTDLAQKVDNILEK
ncbi:MAG: response regulator [Chloroflexi bacterium]|nr:response regulator [Chloroflexota bacterium]